MTIASLYSIAALCCFIAAYFFPPLLLKILLLWTGLSLTFVAYGYFSNNHQIFRKSLDGRIPGFIHWLLWPFMIGTAIYNHSRRTTLFHEVAPNIFVGSRLYKKDIPQLKEAGIKAIMDVTAEFNGLNWNHDDDDLSYFNLPVLDHRFPKTEDLSRALYWIDHQLRNNRPVIIHCALGRGRSVFTCAAYLLAKHPEKSPDDILATIKHTRQVANLNRHQQRHLTQLRNNGELKIDNTLALVVNPVAGGGKWPTFRQQIIQQLSQYYQLSLYETTPECDADECTQKALADGHRHIVAGGGDGTVNLVASQLLNQDITLGILPLGTANALYMAINGEHASLLPINIACDVICSGNSQAIDTIRCNDQVSLLMVGIGFESDMIENADRNAKDDSGQWAYLKSFWQALNDSNSVDLTCQIDDQPAFNSQTASLIVANAAPLSSLLARGNGKPSFTDGRLAVTLIPKQQGLAGNISSLLKILLNNTTPDTATGSDNIDPDSVKTFTPEKISITSDNEFKYVIDGEVFSEKSLNIHINKKSLRMITP